MRWVWIGAAILVLGVAAFATWSAFHNPYFVAGLAGVVATALWALAPDLFKRMPPEDEAAWRKRVLDGSKDDRR